MTNRQFSFHLRKSLGKITRDKLGRFVPVAAIKALQKVTEGKI